MTIIKLATKKHNRLGFIGGSDANRIMRGDWYSLWLEKTGQAQPEDLSDKFNVQLGVASEDFNLQWFCKTNDIDVSRVQKNIMVYHTKVQLMATTLQIQIKM